MDVYGILFFSSRLQQSFDLGGDVGVGGCLLWLLKVGLG